MVFCCCYADDDVELGGRKTVAHNHGRSPTRISHPFVEGTSSRKYLLQVFLLIDQRAVRLRLFVAVHRQPHDRTLQRQRRVGVPVGDEVSDCMNTSSSLVSAPVVSCLQAHHGCAFVRLALHLLGRSGRGLLRRASARTCHAHQQAQPNRSPVDQQEYLK